MSFKPGIWMRFGGCMQDELVQVEGVIMTWSSLGNTPNNFNNQVEFWSYDGVFICN